MRKNTNKVQVKAFGEDGGLQPGQFVAYAAVFETLDSDGDSIKKGAFSETLKDWKLSGAPIPVLWGHDMSDMHNNIGHVVEAEEDDFGLKVTAQLDLDHPNGKQAHRLIEQKRVTDLSFAFDIVEHKVVHAENPDENSYMELLKMNLHEVSVVPIGANRDTEFLAVKSAARKLASAAGRIQSAKSEDDHKNAIKSLADHLIDLGESLRDDEDEQGSIDTVESTLSVYPDGTVRDDDGKVIGTLPMELPDDESEDAHEAPDNPDAGNGEAGDGNPEAETGKSADSWRRKKMEMLRLKGDSK